MKHLIGFFLLLFFFPSVAYSHPADDLCLPGEKDIGDGCIDPFPHLGLNDPEYYSCWRHYQHERRELFAMQAEARALRDQANQYVALNNIVAAQCAASRKCKGKYAFRAAYSFPIGEGCSHKGRAEQQCGPIDFIVDYWKVIPMEVLSRYPGNTGFCKTQIEAAEAGIGIQIIWNWIATQWRDAEQAEFFRRSKISWK